MTPPDLTAPDKVFEALRVIERQAKTIEDLLAALDTINSTIFAVGAPLGSDNYFHIRTVAVSALKKARGVENPHPNRG